jgi:type IV pilus assembly protein PilN
MMSIRSFFQQRPYLIIEFAADSTRLKVVRKWHEGYAILNSQEFTQLDWQNDQAKLTQLLHEIRNNFKCAKTLLSFPLQLTQSHSLPISSELTPAEIIETVHLELTRHHLNINDYYFDFQVINPQEVLIVTLEKSVIANLLKVLQTAKLEPILITNQLTSGETQLDTLINLLPWRERKTQRQQKTFLLSILSTSVLLIIFSTLGQRYLIHETNEAQKKLQRLQIVNKENEELLSTTTQNNQKAQEHQKQINELQTLNARRYFLLHALDLFANKLPEGMYLTALKQQDGTLQIEGHATNHQAVTQLVTLLSANPEFKLAQLQFIKEIANSNQLAFAIQVPELLPKTESNNGLAVE